MGSDVRAARDISREVAATAIGGLEVLVAVEVGLVHTDVRASIDIAREVAATVIVVLAALFPR